MLRIFFKKHTTGLHNNLEIELNDDGSHTIKKLKSFYYFIKILIQIGNQSDQEAEIMIDFHQLS